MDIMEMYGVNALDLEHAHAQTSSAVTAKEVREATGKVETKSATKASGSADGWKQRERKEAVRLAFLPIPQSKCR